MFLKFVGAIISKNIESNQFKVDKFTRLTKIEYIREEIAPKFNQQPKQIRFLCRGKELVDGCNLYEYGVKDGDTILVTVKQLRTDVNCNETLSSPSVSPKSTSDVSLTEIREMDAESKFYRVNDKVDVRCSETDSWFEATIVRITQKLDFVSSADSERISDNDSVIGSDNENIDKVQIPADNLNYHCQYDYYGNLLEIVDLNRLAPRAFKKLPFNNVNVGEKVLVNYNVDVAGELGDWYRALVTSKVEGRKREALIATLLIGNERGNLENCKITKVDEIYAFEENYMLTERKSKNLPKDYPKRTTRQCVWCHDNPRTDCRHCKCIVCGSSDDEANTILCEECDDAYHIQCLTPPLKTIPEDDWYCPECKTDDSAVVKAGEKVKVSKRMSKLPGINYSHNRNWDSGNACKGVTKKCTKVPTNHFGPIPGIEVGTCWLYRWQVAEEGVHRMLVAGIHGRPKDGAFSIVVSGGYEDDVDNGDEITYTGSGGRDLSGNKRTAGQSKEQDLSRFNAALAKSCNCNINEKGGDAGDKWKKGKPVRVVRSYKGHSKYAPEKGCRYDGIYKVVKYWPEKGEGGHLVYRFLLRRDDPVAAPWTKAGRKRIKELGIENVIVPPENKFAKRKNESADAVDDESQPKRSKYSVGEKILSLISKDVVNENIWKECLGKCEYGQKAFVEATEEAFTCIVCSSLLVNPINLPCRHLICSEDLKRAFNADHFQCPTCRFELAKDYEGEINEILNKALKSIFPGYNND